MPNGTALASNGKIDHTISIRFPNEKEKEFPSKIFNSNYNIAGEEKLEIARNIAKEVAISFKIHPKKEGEQPVFIGKGVLELSNLFKNPGNYLINRYLVIENDGTGKNVGKVGV